MPFLQDAENAVREDENRNVGMEDAEGVANENSDENVDMHDPEDAAGENDDLHDDEDAAMAAQDQESVLDASDELTDGNRKQQAFFLTWADPVLSGPNEPPAAVAGLEPQHAPVELDTTKNAPANILGRNF